MLGLSDNVWIIAAVFAVVWIVIAVRVGLSMRRGGRRPWVWFLITLLFSAVPACAVTLYDNFRWLLSRQPKARRGQDRPDKRTGKTPAGPPQKRDDQSPPRPRMIRCGQCQQWVSPEELSPGPVKACPRCGAPLEEGRTA